MGKFCEFLECIDLVEACKAINLEGYYSADLGLSGLSNEGLNIHMQEWFKISLTDEPAIARYAGIELRRHEPRTLKHGYKQAQRLFDETIRELVATEAYFRAMPRHGELADVECVALMTAYGLGTASERHLVAVSIYYYDLVAWFTACKRHLEALACYEVIKAISMSRFEKHGKELAYKIKAIKAAKAKHCYTEISKGRAMKLWDETGQNYSSMSSFAEHNCKGFEVKQRTLYNWVREHAKNGD